MQARITAPGGAEELRMTMTSDVVLPDRVHTRMVFSDSLSAETQTLEVVSIGPDTYVYFDPSLTANGQGMWVLIDDSAALSQPEGRDITWGADLVQLVSALPVLPGAQTIGDETIDGVPTTHTRTTVDAMTYVGAADDLPLTLDLWTGTSDTFPRHLTLTGTLRIDPDRLLGQPGGKVSSAEGPADAVLSYTDAGAGSVDAPARFDLEFTDLNAPLAVEAPATYVTLADLFK
jgi:hypothetical protein